MGEEEATGGVDDGKKQQSEGSDQPEGSQSIEHLARIDRLETAVDAEPNTHSRDIRVGVGPVP